MKRKKGRKQYLCIKQQLKRLTKEEYLTLRELCHAAKNLYNEGLYSVRQHFFRTGKYLPYSGNYPLLKNSENYKTLNSNMAQQILKEVDGTFRSFLVCLDWQDICHNISLRFHLGIDSLVFFHAKQHPDQHSDGQPETHPQ